MRALCVSVRGVALSAALVLSAALLACSAVAGRRAAARLRRRARAARIVGHHGAAAQSSSPPAKPVADDDLAAQLTVLSGLRQVSQSDLDRYAEKPASLKQLIESGRGSSVQCSRQAAIDHADRTDRRRTRTALSRTRRAAEARRSAPQDLSLRIHARRRRRLRRARSRRSSPCGCRPSLLADKEHDEPIGVQGLLVKNAGTTDAPHPVFFARRPAWYPETYLGELGMDYGLYDDVRDVTERPEARARSPLSLAGDDEQGRPSEALRRRRRPTTIPSRSRSASCRCSNDPNSDASGKLVRSKEPPAARSPSCVNDPDVQERFGIKKYYEVADLHARLAAESDLVRPARTAARLSRRREHPCEREDRRHVAHRLLLQARRHARRTTPRHQARSAKGAAADRQEPGVPARRGPRTIRPFNGCSLCRWPRRFS